jgi:hypothetical protein
MSFNLNIFLEIIYVKVCVVKTFYAHLMFKQTLLAEDYIIFFGLPQSNNTLQFK